MLLLHGLGATGAVWRGYDGVAPDLPGHGTAAWESSYSFERYAETVRPLLERFDRPVPLLGHSMGGVVALVLAAKAPDRVAGVVGLGIKVVWSVEDVARAAAMAQRPVATYATREEAAARFLRVSGLAWLVAPDDPVVGTAVVREGAGWRLAQDPRTFGVGVPDMQALLGAVDCPVVLARGELDPMVSHAEAAALVTDAVTLPGLGHNAHVEDPAAVRALVP